VISSKLKTAPASNPITLPEAKNQLNVELAFIDDDGIIGLQTKAATNYLQNRTGKQFMQATWNLVLDSWRYDCNLILELPIAPLVKVISVKYYDIANVLQTLAGTEYRINNYNEPGGIHLFGNLPSTYTRPDAVIVEYVAGFGADGDNDATQQAAVPEELKTAIKLLLTDFYEFRGENVQGASMSQVAKGIDMLISEHKVYTKGFYEHASVK
jgi:uncharacterized phiE125 gp8 family phage protein